MSSTSSSSEGDAEYFDRGNGSGSRTVDVPGSGSGVGDLEDPSSSRRRRRRQDGNNDVWPEPFLESLAAQVAIDASRTFGRLAAAPSLVNVFQVCSTWRAVSRSELLWARLSQQVWARNRLTQQTWHDEYIYWHQTSTNFRIGRSMHSTLQFDPLEVNDNPDGLICRCLALSELHLACGFADGTVRLFDLTSLDHLGTYQPHHLGGLGLHPRAVSGIILSDSRLVFATLDGDVHVVPIGVAGQLRRAHTGDVVNDGALVDFTGCSHWWVGLYAGVPGRAFHIWDDNSEEVVFIGGSLTDPESLMGWRMLTELTQFVGHVRVNDQETAVACTNTRVVQIDLRNHGVVIGEQRYRRGVIVTATDVNNEAYIIVDTRGIATVRRLVTSEQVCRFRVSGAAQGRAIGCMNSGYAVISAGGTIGTWEVHHGEALYSFGDGLGEVLAIIADDRYIVASLNDATIHLWDFSAAQ
ncbi:hypothetical protein MLD38_003005 [Melastoma candidum]|uniref:Uncharacterized protein n=1 Tax=Melastoma candidum TaxID=119954 RepID=A0ACB9S4B8_9MYRT|nr:hypothetical protein MLD38_003005 [Melastoma candidum]